MVPVVLIAVMVRWPFMMVNVLSDDCIYAYECKVVAVAGRAAGLASMIVEGEMRSNCI